jgi:branched-chain amino acid transport system substrate-binding protein
MADQVQAISAPPGDQFTWEQLPDMIDALQNGEDVDYQGASGPIDMDDNGDATAGVYDIYEFKNDVPETTDEIKVTPPNE